MSGTEPNGKSPDGGHSVSTDPSAEAQATQERLERELIDSVNARNAEAQAQAAKERLEREQITNAKTQQLMNYVMMAQCVEQCIQRHATYPRPRVRCAVSPAKVHVENPLVSDTGKHGVRTDGIFAYFWRNGWKQGSAKAAVVLDNGLAFVWSYPNDNNNSGGSQVFEVPVTTRRNLASIVARSAMFSNSQRAERCGADGARGYLYIATHGVGRQMANCSVGEERQVTNGGYYALRDKLSSLLGINDATSELEGEAIDFDDMAQSIQEYLKWLPTGDARRIQVAAWLDWIARIEKGTE